MTTRTRTRLRHLAAATALAGGLLGLTTGAASADSGIDTTPVNEASGFGIGPLPLPLPGPSPLPIPLPAPQPDTELRPELRSPTGCTGGAVWTDAKDPDGSDLRMTIEVSTSNGRGWSTPTTMSYTAFHDYWSGSINAGDPNVTIQATDEDGFHSRAMSFTRDFFGNCVLHKAWDNSKTEDIFENLGAR